MSDVGDDASQTDRFDWLAGLEAPESSARGFEILGTDSSGTSCLLRAIDGGRLTLSAHRDEDITLRGQVASLDLEVAPDAAALGVLFFADAPDAPRHVLGLVDSAEKYGLQQGVGELEFALGRSMADTREGVAVRAGLVERGYSVTDAPDGYYAWKRLPVPDFGGDSGILSQGADAQPEALDSAVARASSEIQGLDYEVAYSFDSQGNAIFRQEGARDYVSFTAEQVEAAQGCEVMLHNHPSGCSFSGADVASAYSFNPAEMRVIGSGGDVYTLRPPEGMTFRESARLPGSPLAEAIRLDEAAGRAPGSLDSLTRQTIQSQYGHFNTQEQESLRHSITHSLIPLDEAYRAHYDRVMNSVAAHYGLVYERVNG